MVNMISEPFGIETIQPSEIDMSGIPEIPAPLISVTEATDFYCKCALEPLDRGYGMTLGNSLRRVLLSSMTGAAVTWVKIEGVLHEYTTIPNVKEEVMELLLNIKRIRVRSLSDRSTKLRLEVSGEGVVSAGDILASSDCEILNPELHLATLDSSEAKLSIEFNVESGKGYQTAETAVGLPIGVLPVDAIFSPLRKVNYNTERVRIGQVSDYERLVIEVWTDGTVTPVEAIREASRVLVEHFFPFNNIGKEPPPGAERAARAQAIPVEQYNAAIEGLNLSSRTLNCLKRANLNKVGEVLEMQPSELIKIRNFGEKSLDELNQKLAELGLLNTKEESEENLDTSEDPEEETIIGTAGLQE